MHLSTLRLTQYRCYSETAIDIAPSGIRVIGVNASGKSSLLEAIGLLATTRSFRGARDRDLINWDSGPEYGLAPFGRVEGKVHTRSGIHDLGIAMQLADDGESMGSKRFFVDGRATTAHDMVGHLTTVAFTPEDVQLVIGPPSERRRALDILISQIDRAYLRHLSRYGRVVQQRNGLLKSFARDRVQPTGTQAVTQLSFWDEQLVAEGGYLIAARARALAALGLALERRSSEVIGDDRVEINYGSRTDIHLPGIVSPDDMASAVATANASLLEHLESLRPEEFRRGVTLTGPHRDDVVFEIGGRSLARFGSRGQQRLVVLAMKLAEADVILERSSDPPVFLLDDVLSELDRRHRDLLLDAVVNHGSQVILTSAEEHVGEHPALKALGSFVTPVDADHVT